MADAPTVTNSAWFRKVHGLGHFGCRECELPWPCPIIQLCDALDRSEERVSLLRGMPLTHHRDCLTERIDHEEAHCDCPNGWPRIEEETMGDEVLCPNCERAMMGPDADGFYASHDACLGLFHVDGDPQEVQTRCECDCSGPLTNTETHLLRAFLITMREAL